MKSLRDSLFCAALLPVVFGILLPRLCRAEKPSLDETIVLIRHGEKPRPAIGQLSCKGLNRALALPEVLKRYGKPDAIYAPNPSVRIRDGKDWKDDSQLYSYVRPLATIEPYAIQMDMPVNTQIGYNELDKLEAELLQPAYAHGRVLLAWEHIQSYRFAQKLLAEFGEDPKMVPEWLNSDYDTIYVFHLTAEAQGKKHLEFRIEHEGLDGKLSESCPTGR